MTQHELIIEYCKEFGSIIPAKMGGKEYRGGYFGSQVDKRCRELYSSDDPGNPYREQILDRKREGKFTKYFLKNMGLANKTDQELYEMLMSIRKRLASDTANLWYNQDKIKEIDNTLTKKKDYKIILINKLL
jgi:hypothetical protein